MKRLLRLPFFDRFKHRSAWRLAAFAPILLAALFAPEPYSRFASVLGMLVNFLTGENLLKKFRELAGLSRPPLPPPPPGQTRAD